jgi:hypothetical protein
MLTYATRAARLSQILGNGQEGCLVSGYHTSLKIRGGSVRINALTGISVRGGAFAAVRGQAEVSGNHEAGKADAPQATVDGIGSWLDVVASTLACRQLPSTLASATNQEYPAQVNSRMLTYAHVCWRVLAYADLC